MWHQHIFLWKEENLFSFFFLAFGQRNIFYVFYMFALIIYCPIVLLKALFTMGFAVVEENEG